MRGKRTHARMVSVQSRIIPAHAGQTAASTLPTRRRTDHPRACGANCNGVNDMPDIQGSSPRMRGKHRLQELEEFRRRIIPAHAGQTNEYIQAIHVWTDHPRACGANSRSDSICARPTGSSPRMRGKPGVGQLGLGTPRIIPAHAGQTFCMSNFFSCGPDHPRACGANYPCSMSMPTGYGSSPRMRGKLDDLRDMLSRVRIIPAHAGQTASGFPHGERMPDHPRACGANNVSVTSDGAVSGSSPRMRGKLPLFFCSSAVRRIIPAHAGQTFPSPTLGVP